MGLFNKTFVSPGSFSKSDAFLQIFWSNSEGTHTIANLLNDRKLQGYMPLIKLSFGKKALPLNRLDVYTELVQTD